MLPSRPGATAERIVGDVAGRVDEDFAELGPGLADDVRASDHWHPLMEAERLATEAVRDRWQALEEACERALGDVHESYLVQASYVLEALEELRERGVESWIARALIHDRAFNLAWNVLDDLDLLNTLPEPGEEEQAL